jgi:DNA repair exonuclease SbcCD ATPase subunit
MISEVYGKNLFSWPLLKYPITKGISQISGMNHDDGNYEGSGKSSVANIWCWTWYGKIPKEAKIDECVMDGEKNAVGETTLLTGGKIIRRRGKNQGLFIASPSGKESKASQDEVDQLVGMSFQVFCQAVYSAQNYEKRFINADEETRAKILTEIRGIKVYDKARKVAEVAERESDQVCAMRRSTYGKSKLRQE